MFKFGVWKCYTDWSSFLKIFSRTLFSFGTLLLFYYSRYTRYVAFPVHVYQVMRAHLPFFPSTHPHVWILEEQERRITEKCRTSWETLIALWRCCTWKVDTKKIGNKRRIQMWKKNELVKWNRCSFCLRSPADAILFPIISTISVCFLSALFLSRRHCL